MNKLILILTLFIGFTLQAQRFAVVDTQYILEHMPEYELAQENINTHIEKWSAEVKLLEDELKLRRAELQEKKILFTDQQYIERQDVFRKKEEQLELLKNRIYGPEGDLVRMRERLVMPIQNRIYNAVKLISESEKFAFVFDKSRDLIVLYSEPNTNFDITERVLRRLILIRGAAIKAEEESKEEPKSK